MSLCIQSCSDSANMQRRMETIYCGNRELTHHEQCCQWSPLTEICLRTTARSTHAHWIRVAMQTRELLCFLCRWDVEIKQPQSIPFHFNFLNSINGHVAVQGLLSVSDNTSAFSDTVQPT